MRGVGGGEGVVDVAPVVAAGAVGARICEDAGRVVGLDVVPVLTDGKAGDGRIGKEPLVNLLQIRMEVSGGWCSLVAIVRIFDADVGEDTEWRAEGWALCRRPRCGDKKRREGGEQDREHSRRGRGGNEVAVPAGG